MLSRLGGSAFSVSVCDIFYPLSDAPSQSLLCYLVATILYWVWYTRNLATFRNSSLSSKAITNLIIKDIKLRIRCALPDAVRNFWSKDSVLCSVDDNENIVFAI